MTYPHRLGRKSLGYRLYDLDRGVVFSSNDVDFDETNLTAWRDHQRERKLRRSSTVTVGVGPLQAPRVDPHVAPTPAANPVENANAPDVASPLPEQGGDDAPDPNEFDLGGNFSDEGGDDVPHLEPESEDLSATEDEFDESQTEYESDDDYEPDDDDNIAVTTGLNEPAWTPPAIDHSDSDDCKVHDARPDRVTGKPARYAEYYLVQSSDPKGWSQAMKSSKRDKWLEAANQELDALRKSGTFEDVKLPPGKMTISGVWVFKTKLDKDGQVERYKARLCARGFLQVKGIHFDETYAPVAKLKSIRILIALAALLNLKLTQMDVVAAYLNGEIDDKHEIYMKPPPGYTTEKSGSVLRLRKALYGLKQSGRAWNSKLDKHLRSIGFKPTNADPSIYVRHKNGPIVLVGVYVDDFIIADNDDSMRATLKDDLEQAYEMKDLGELEWILGMRVTRDWEKHTITLDQCQYTEQLLQRFRMENCNTAPTPGVPGSVLRKAGDDYDPKVMKDVPYRNAVGGLMYLMCGTRPDIAVEVGRLSQHLEKPTKLCWSAAKRVLRYMKGHNHGITYHGNANTRPSTVETVGFVDSDYGSDLDTRRSTTGYVFMLAGGAISWESRRQRTVALSTTEAEYMALTAAIKEAIWCRRFLGDLGFPQKNATRLMEDNQGCIALARNPVMHQRSKHIDIKYHFNRESVEAGVVDPKYVPTKENLADVFTKSLNRPAFQYLRDQMLGDRKISAVLPAVVVEPTDDVLLARIIDCRPEAEAKRVRKTHSRVFTFSANAIARSAKNAGLKTTEHLRKLARDCECWDGPKISLPKHLFNVQLR